MNTYFKLSKPFRNWIVAVFIGVALPIVLVGCGGLSLDSIGIGESAATATQEIPNPRAEVLAVENFDGERAYQDAVAQMEFGPKIPGSEGHRKIQQWLVDTLTEYGWDVRVQEFTVFENDYANIVARNSGEGPPVIFGAHYDTRIRSDQDANPNFQPTPVPGANDGASGVAVLMELARAIPEDYDENVWLVFFDAEDNGSIEGLDWIMGSTYFAENLPTTPEVVVIADMIGDADLNIYYEKNSTPGYRTEIWDSAAELGYDQAFIPEEKYKMIDDHLPFIRMGIPGVDLIDFDYEYWHTTEDTIDKISPESLEMVGRTLLYWLIHY